MGVEYQPAPVTLLGQHSDQQSVEIVAVDHVGLLRGVAQVVPEQRCCSGELNPQHHDNVLHPGDEPAAHQARDRRAAERFEQQGDGYQPRGAAHHPTHHRTSHCTQKEQQNLRQNHDRPEQYREDADWHADPIRDDILQSPEVMSAAGLNWFEPHDPVAVDVLVLRQRPVIAVEAQH